MERITVALVQKSELKSKGWFINLVQQLSQEDFERFCKEVMHLNHYYDTTQGLHVTDVDSVAIVNDSVMWKLEEVDFNADINFKKIS